MDDKHTILIVDDELSVRKSLEHWFLEDGFAVETAEDGNEALEHIKEHLFDIYLVDIKMPGMDGITLQKKIKEIHDDALVIIITAYASVDTAVEALKHGAFDYVTKPIDPDDLSHMIRNALKQKQLSEENVRLKEQISELGMGEKIIGESVEMQRVFNMIEQVAETDSTVLVRGESGTGKELIARAIHTQSNRRYFPIVAVNCGSIPETLLESELFGHEKGAFTGAQYRRKGKLELADGGTLFLDEVGDITAKMQVDLLRVLEDRTFTRLGGNEEITSDFRLICATNKDLEEAVEEGEFRKDLYYRINVFSIFVPPLRERRSDIIPLAEHFIKKYARSMAKPERELTAEARDILVKHTWPGNVRELENAIERAMVVGQGETIEEDDLPVQLKENGDEPDSMSLEAMEKVHIQKVLDQMDGNVTQSAKLLGIDRVTLYNKMKKYGIQR
ncbi:MAG: sigma-54 dependent transcriptional regulator [Candidatus Marinimicrobia bacterium]|nr:sigma-54 dependent transcriptional regulator [Candidatus Neomarinimicrobiota bacterium]MCF7827592.1 sigma-54 dependent transcriptional regulator [Candidatus Neomarinimicrobiota bacterium]MCF7881547.1 sigma-54 dependent transcriptional regulator [Candidatus Neomarinimicrobiota bacterium]